MLNFASCANARDVIELAALLLPDFTITSWAVAQSTAALQPKQLSDVLEELVMIRHKAQRSAGGGANNTQLGAKIQ